MRNLLFVSMFAALFAATDVAAAQRTIDDPPGAAFQDQGYREMKGLEPRRAPTAGRTNLSDRAPTRKQITPRKHGN
jgi:hypothetical protein